MTKKTGIFWFISITILILGTAWVFPLGDGGISITGEIINGTNGLSLNEQLYVSLTVYSEDSEVRTYETASDTKDFFTFTEVDLITGDLIVAQTEYLGVTYFSDEVVYDQNQDLPELEIVVFEATTNPESIGISQYDILINRVGDQLRIGEYYLISNQGELTWIGEMNPQIDQFTTLEFNLPVTAQNLWFSGEGLDERYFNTGHSFVDTKPIPPGDGTVEVFFSYEIPFTDSLQLIRKNAFSSDEVEIMVSESSAVTITGEKIQPEGTIETDLGTAFAFSVDPIKPNESLTITIADDMAISKSFPFMEVLFGMILLSAATTSIFWFWHRSDKKVLPDGAGPLLENIAELDHDYQNNQISKLSYQRQREALMEEIKHLESN